MKYRRHHFSLLCGLALLAGCQVLPERLPAPAVHDFGPTQTNVDESRFPWAAVRVEAPDWLQEPLIRFRLLYDQPTQVRFYGLDRWAAPPPELLASRLAADRSAEGYELKLELQALEQVFDRPDRSSVLLRFHAAAIDPPTGQLVAERIFSLSHPTRSADAAGAVDASSLLVKHAVSQLAGWFRGLPHHPGDIATPSPAGPN